MEIEYGQQTSADPMDLMREVTIMASKIMIAPRLTQMTIIGPESEMIQHHSRTVKHLESMDITINRMREV